jgi:hypothetical protein
MARRRLRKGERQQLDAAIAPTLEAVRPSVLEIKRIVAEHMIPAVPTELRQHAIIEVLNVLADEIVTDAEYAGLLLDENGNQS